MSNRSWVVAGLTLVLCVGALLRLVWPADMEFKGDEIFTFERTQQIGVTESWSWVGMNNSADVPHPGMSVWVFVALARLTGTHDPVSLNVVCMALNVLALAALALFIGRVVSPDEREPWWWGLAILSVNPLAVVFHRKIWPPSVLPCITVLLLTTWWFRSKSFGALGFGVIAALAAQIHPGAFFFVAGLGVWTLIFDRNSFRWLWALAGGLLGSIPAWPWIWHLLTLAHRSATARASWLRYFELKFWVYWFTEPFGFNLQYSLGADFGEFLSGPLISGRSTFIVAILHAVLAVTLILVLGRWILAFFHSGDWGLGRSPTGLIIGAVGISYGAVLTLTGLPVYRHYLIIAAPVMCTALARVTLANFERLTARRLLAGLCATQAMVSVLFLWYVHTKDGPIRGDYGTPYRVQTQDFGKIADLQDAP